MLTRNLRLAAIKHVQPYRCVWSSRVKTLPPMQPAAMKWITGSHFSFAHYSKDNKKEVPLSFISCNKNNRSFTTSFVNLTSNPAPNPNIPLNSTNPTLTSVLPTDISASSSSSNCTSPPNPPSSPNPPSPPNPSSPPSTPNTSDTSKTKDTGCSAGSIGEAGLRLPKKEEVEHFLFKLLVYLWDFTYYVFCMSRKIIQTYVINNSTVQNNWKQLVKRMDAARKEIKPK